MKKSFTLIELIISTSLTSVIILSFYNINHILTTKSKIIHKNILSKTKKAQYKSIIYKDILESTSLKITNNNLYKLITKHSIYRSNYTFVTYIFNKKAKQLFRIESLDEFKLNSNYERFNNSITILLIDNITNFQIKEIKMGQYIIKLDINKKTDVIGIRR